MCIQLSFGIEALTDHFPCFIRVQNLISVCDFVIDEVRQSNFFFQLHGFTCGVDDLLLCQESDKRRREILGTSEQCSEEIHRKFTQTGNDLEGLWNVIPEIFFAQAFTN